MRAHPPVVCSEKLASASTAAKSASASACSAVPDVSIGIQMIADVAGLLSITFWTY
jgi:hypothetical protein